MIDKIEILDISDGIVEFRLGNETCNVQIEEQEVWESDIFILKHYEYVRIKSSEEPVSFNGLNDKITYDLCKHVYRITVMSTLECGLKNMDKKEEICAQLNKMLND